MSSLLAEPVFSLLSHALDVASLRQAVHTANVANASTEGYQRLEVDFDAQLQLANASLGGESNNVDDSFPEARVVTAGDGQVRLDQEMALMAKDALRYEMLLGAVGRTTSLLHLAIKEGREG